MLTWPANSPDHNPIKYLWDVIDEQVQGGQMNCCSLGVHVSMCQGCFGSKWKTHTILGHNFMADIRCIEITYKNRAYSVLFFLVLVYCLNVIKIVQSPGHCLLSPDPQV